MFLNTTVIFAWERFFYAKHLSFFNVNTNLSYNNDTVTYPEIILGHCFYDYQSV